MPVLALVCLVAGWLSLLLALVVCLILLAASYGVMIFGGLAVLAGFGDQEGEGAGCGFIVIGAIMAVVGYSLCSVFAPWYDPVWEFAFIANDACYFAADYLFSEVFLAYQIYLWSWSVALAALLAAAVVLLTIGVLKLESPLKRWLLRVRFSCSAADCNFSGVPAFRCDGCNKPIVDLAPTMYGVFHAQCEACQTSLSTTDLLGRLRLDKQCPRCASGLDHPDFGRLEEMHFMFAGASSSGKSNLMVAAIRELEEIVAPAMGLRMEFANAAQEQEFRNRCRLMDQGRVLEKTVSNVKPPAFTISLKNVSGEGALLYIYDTDGSDFEQEDRLMGHGFHAHTAGVVLVIDPFAERNINSLWTADDAPEIWQQRPATVGANDVLGSLISRYEHALAQGADTRLSIPMSIVVSKVDAFQLETRTGPAPQPLLNTATVQNAAAHAASQSERVRQFLRENSLGNIVNNAESRFGEVKYFPASALGRAYEAQNGQAFQSRGAWAPLFWLMWKAGVISDSPGAVRVLSNAWGGFVSAMQWREDWRAGLGAWVFTTSVAAIGIMSLAHFVGVMASVGLTVIGLAAAAGAFWRHRHNQRAIANDWRNMP